jgi:hypothetical protein
MICVRLEGGLGNQLFQYAAGRALAARLGRDLLIDSSRLQRRTSGVTKRALELGRFRHAGRVATPEECRHLPWLHRVAPISHWITPWRTYVERGLAYNAQFGELPDQTYLVGYWQSFRYFEQISQLLAAELQPVDALSPASETVASQIEACTAVAIHVRRGDYVSLPSAAGLHGALAVSYYGDALAHARERLPHPRFFVFSDDSAWCEKHLPLDREEVTYVNHNTGQAAWQDLALMSRCHHHIIANSSFSWWGAWLADQRHGETGHLVIAPARWFAGQPQQDHRDRFPSHWVVQP